MQNDTIFQSVDRLTAPGSLEVRRKLDRVAKLETPVLLLGETGSGKDAWAEYLHGVSRRSPLLNLHCGDVPETLLESEWFGYKRGAFTGAEQDFPGKWLSAGNGTLFLNRVDLLTLNIQAKLLRIIERRRYFPLGDVSERSVRARFVFSADHNLEERVRAGQFRADLFYRISTLTVSIPPLRERPDDVRSLLNHFARESGVPLRLSGRGWRKLCEYPWPGNIRELQNVVASAQIVGEALTDETVDALVNDAGTILEIALSREWSMDRMEEEYIRFLMRKYSHRTTVARILGISRKSLYNRLKRYESD